MTFLIRSNRLMALSTERFRALQPRRARCVPTNAHQCNLKAAQGLLKKRHLDARDTGDMMRKIALALIAALPLAATAKDNPDESFFHKATQAGHAEIQAGKVAQKRATNPVLKEFAATMVKDHTAANDRLGTIANSKGVPLPTAPSPEQKALNEEIEKKPRESFDKDYIQSQIEAHEDTVALLQKEIAEGKDAEAKAFASETLPRVKAHLEWINRIAAAGGHD
jgi:putative membrane protein